jgi:Protein of unknown function (DUF3558)
MRLPVVIALALCSVALAACGGSDSKPAPGSAENPLTATRPAEAEAGQGAGTAATGEPSAAAPKPGYKALVDRQTSKPAHRFSPCNLVTRPEARAIVGKPLHEPVEAPQGPTCIYRPRAGKALITLAIQDMSFKAIKRRMANLREVAVSDRTAYCGTYGQPVLYVPLDADRLLSVNAECDVARGFAAKALRHL